MPLTTGTRLGAYEIIAAIGAGGMGEVYRVRDTRLNRDVAIKVLPELFAADPERLARFEREAQAVAALSHPNILAIHDFGTSGRTAYAVTELLEGQTLRERLEAGGIPIRKAVDYARQAALGLAAAHERGIVVSTALDFGRAAIVRRLGPAAPSARRAGPSERTT
jgi:serine/threonine protein kinase